MYTKEDLVKLVDMIDDAYRPYTSDNTKGAEILEDFFEHSFRKPIVEEKVSFTYDFLRRKLDWTDFCDLTGIHYYAKAEGYEIKDSEIFYVTESKAKEYGLL